MYTTTSKCLPLYLHTTTIPTAHNALHELRPRRLVQSRNWRSDDSRVQKEMACENSSTNCSIVQLCAMPPGESARPVKAGCYRPARSSFFDCDDGTAQPPTSRDISRFAIFGRPFLQQYLQQQQWWCRSRRWWWWWCDLRVGPQFTTTDRRTSSTWCYAAA